MEARDVGCQHHSAIREVLRALTVQHVIEVTLGVSSYVATLAYEWAVRLSARKENEDDTSEDRRQGEDRTGQACERATTLERQPPKGQNTALTELQTERITNLGLKKTTLITCMPPSERRLTQNAYIYQLCPVIATGQIPRFPFQPCSSQLLHVPRLELDVEVALRDEPGIVQHPVLRGVGEFDLLYTRSISKRFRISILLVDSSRATCFASRKRWK
jgi:hypothetical protein